MPDIASFLSAALAVVAFCLLIFAAAAIYALIQGSAELRRTLHASSNEFRAVLLKSPIVPGVSVVYVAPAYSPGTRAIVRRLLDLHYANSELVIVLDGPSPAELSRWIEEWRLTPLDGPATGGLATGKIRACYTSRDPLRLLVLDKEAGGQADAFNAGVDAARYPVIGMVDDEASFIPEVLLYLIRPMLEAWDRTLGVCGVAPEPVDLGSGEGRSGSFASRIAAIETLRCWLTRGAAFSAWNRLVPVPGCCMLVKRDAVVSAGGFRGGPLELFLALHTAARASNSPYRIGFVPAPVSWRPAAHSWHDVHRQVVRDQKMLTAALRNLGPGAGLEFLGLFCIRVVRPLLETAGLLLAVAGLATGTVPPALAGVFLLASAGTGIVVSMAAIVLRQVAEPDGIAPSVLVTLFLTSFPENLGYRQIRNLWLISAFFRE